MLYVDCLLISLLVGSATFAGGFVLFLFFVSARLYTCFVTRWKFFRSSKFQVWEWWKKLHSTHLQSPKLELPCAVLLVASLRVTTSAWICCSYFNTSNHLGVPNGGEKIPQRIISHLSSLREYTWIYVFTQNATPGKWTYFPVIYQKR